MFSLSWLIFFFPIGVAGTLWFWQRRDKQPIKAREPLLVVLTDVVLLVYLVLLCLQRIVRDSYPCLLNLWNGYIGTIILLNTYLWRCTHASRLETRDLSASQLTQLAFLRRLDPLLPFPSDAGASEPGQDQGSAVLHAPALVRQPGLPRKGDFPFRDFLDLIVPLTDLVSRSRPR